MSVENEKAPPGNPFSPIAVATPFRVPEFTIETEPFRRIRGCLDDYLRESAGQGNTVVVVGEHGTGKTHTAMGLVRSVIHPLITSVYLEAGTTFRETYLRLVNQLGIDYFVDLSGKADRKLRESVSDLDFLSALSMLGQADLKTAAWDWLTGHPPDENLLDEGITWVIDSEAAALNAMVSIAQLHGALRRKLLVMLDDVRVVQLSEFRSLLEVVSTSGVMLVLLGTPDLLEQLGADIRRRVGQVIAMTPFGVEDVRALIVQAQGLSSGRYRLEPFTEEAVSHLVELSGGNVRTVIRLCRQTFQRAAAEDVPANAVLVDQVARDTLPIEAEPERPGVQEKSDVDWTTDTPTEIDLLKRDALAEVLATRITETRERHPGTSLIVHVDGEWGAGKSTLLGLLGRRLAGEGLLVTPFDAWQQSRLSPPWWALLTAVRNAIVQDRGWWARRRLKVKELAARARRSGAPFVLSAILLLLGAGGIGLLVRAVVGTQQPGSEWLKVALSAIAAVGVLWPGVRVAGRVLLWDSAGGARLFEQTGANPMGRVAEHFDWLLRQSGKPIVLFIDDLDRCKHDYVVEVLEAVQTLLRDTPGRHRGRSGNSRAAYVVVSADGYWIRQSFTTSYLEFDSDGRRAAGALGYQFMDKLFQLTVPMPALGSAGRRRFLGHLLDVPDGEAELQKAAAAVEARAKIQAAAGDEGRILAALDAVTEPEIRDVVAVDAVRAVAAPETQTNTEHMLRKFAPLIGGNPREIKLFLNTYSILRAVRTLEGNTPETGLLALWAVLRVRWPAVADHLHRQPASVLGIREPQWSPDLFPEHLLDVVRSKELRAVVGHPGHGPLTEDAIRRCCGAD
ncbi:P-loop NTPase fold protein [Amycolatopsis kentuckyensis]|uniref:P-loop NTPase fold protein n=1 Tax=Amycolatopsis kentuckyensis TaxID=218823 RepID=UPI000A35F2FC|nr:P-loop NTPase fold protein [Amycolatopsis kentuckyensis]